MKNDAASPNTKILVKDHFFPGGKAPGYPPPENCRKKGPPWKGWSRVSFPLILSVGIVGATLILVLLNVFLRISAFDYLPWPGENPASSSSTLGPLNRDTIGKQDDGNATTNKDDVTPVKVNMDGSSSCQSPSCQEAVREMWSSMNTSVDPCDNFYDYACQGWMRLNPRPQQMLRWNVVGKLREETTQRIIDILLQSSKIPEDPEGLNKARLFYQTCLKVGSPSQEKRAWGLLWETLEEYGGWPLLYPEGTWNNSKFSWEQSVTALRRRFNRATIFEVEVVNRTTLLKPATFTWMDLAGGEGDSEAKREIATQFIVNVTRDLLLSRGQQVLNESYMREKAEEILRVTQELVFLANQSVANKGNTTKINVTLEMLQDSSLDWAMDINSLLEGVYAHEGVPISNPELITVSNLGYFQAVSHFFSRITPEALANFLHFQMTLEMTFFTSRQMQEYVQTVKDTFGRKPDKRPWSSWCLKEILKKFHHAIGYAFVRSHFSNWTTASHALEVASKMFPAVKHQFVQQLESSQGTTHNKTKLAAKIASIKVCLGFPPGIFNVTRLEGEYAGLTLDPENFLAQYLSVTTWWGEKEDKLSRQGRDSSLDTCDWYRFVGQIGAYFNHKYAQAYIPMGILQPPYFSVDFPRFMRYGRLGCILGHELTHGLIREGWTKFENGSLTPNALCFARQYDNFSIAELYPEKVTLDGNLTLGENIPDNVGLRQAFHAYQQDASERKENLPGELAHFTEDQLFFLAFAQNWCESKTLTSWKRSLQEERHSPGLFRVLGTLRNSPEFARSWNCAPGSNMNPGVTHQCSMF